MYKRFGKNVSVSYNFNGYLEDEKEPLCKNIGWININKIVSDCWQTNIVNSLFFNFIAIHQVSVIFTIL